MSDRRTGQYSVVRHDSSPAKAAEDAADAREFGKTVHVQYGQVKVAIPSVVIGGAVVWLVTRFFGPGVSADCASRGDMNALSKKVDEMSAAQYSLAATIAKNADTAHNETEGLRATVTRNADRSEGGIQRLSDKLDVFLRR